jgi:hypothetical protein
MTEPWSLESMLKKLALVKALCPDPGPLLPNLTEVKVIPSSQILWVPVVAAVLHSGVRRLVIQPPDSDGPSFFTYPDFFREVLRRAPLLESLEIGENSMLTFSRVWRDEDASILARYACQFPQLTRLAAPPSVVVELEDVRTALPNLRALLEISVLRPKTYVHDLRGRWPTRVGTKIETLAVSVPFASASQLLVANRMSSLRILYLDAQILEPQQLDMTEFCRTLATQCPALEELIINWVGGWNSFPGLMMGGEIDVAQFEPLAGCTLLSVLEISAPCTLAFDQDGAERLATALSRLRICRLTFIPLRGPLDEHHTLPGLATLIPFASHCHQLEKLSLILDPKLPDDGVLPTIRFSPAFRNLSIGHFVDAAGWDASAVARYLAQLVPRYCSLTIPPAPHWRTVWTNLDEIAEGENHLKDAFELVPTYI